MKGNTARPERDIYPDDENSFGTDAPNVDESDPEPESGRRDSAYWKSRVPTEAEDMDWGDVYTPVYGQVEIRGNEGEESSLMFGQSDPDKSGVHRTLMPHELEIARSQERAMKIAESLVHSINDLIQGLEVPELEGNKELVRRFYGEVAELAKKYGLDPAKSNVLKMLDGLGFEFGAILTAPDFVTDKVKSRRLLGVKRVLSDFMNALLAVRTEGSWDAIEEAVPRILHILPIKKGQIADLSIGLLLMNTREMALAAIEGAAREVTNPSRVMQQQLDQFASGDVTLENLKRREADWERLIYRAESLPKENGDESSAEGEI
jgi:hypothetical protein